MSSNADAQQRALDAFGKHFAQAPSVLVQAPGRVNLIGEHTDYNGGFVLPCAIGFSTWVAVRARGDAVVRVVAADVANVSNVGDQRDVSNASAARDEFRLDATITQRSDAPWADYVRGVFWVLQQRGHALGGVDIAIAGSEPQGAGLSSSASLQVAMATALREALSLPGLDPTTIALVAQEAENRFVGCQCGIMDQLVSARGQAGHALLIDCRSLATRAVPLPAGVAVLIAESGVHRGLVDSAYNERRLQCQAAATHLGVQALRDATRVQLEAARGSLDAVAWRRARHIVTENTRTQAAAGALAEGDLATMGRLMAESHRSMRDDFEITVPAIDRLVEIAQQASGAAGGARMTGGGFGGCIVAVLPEAMVATARAAIEANYRAPSGEAATIYVCRASAGAGRL